MNVIREDGGGGQPFPVRGRKFIPSREDCGRSQDEDEGGRCLGVRDM